MATSIPCVSKENMRSSIEKLSKYAPAVRRRALNFPSARTALRGYLSSVSLNRPCVLLPAYIGWTSREGSGVFDPIRGAGLGYGFYRMTSRLEIDLDHLSVCLRSGKFGALILIHYFGYVDPSYETAIALARQVGVIVIEDEAHALFTDLIGNRCGRMGDVAVFSLHKLLPVPVGGMLVYPPGTPENDMLQPAEWEDVCNPWDFDLAAIARRRRENAAVLTECLQPLAGRIDPLWGMPDEGMVPQTYPVLVRIGSRDRLHRLLNERGYGATTLYYHLINEIDQVRFPDSYALSRHILNLPLHHEATPNDLHQLVSALSEVLQEDE